MSEYFTTIINQTSTTTRESVKNEHHFQVGLRSKLDSGSVRYLYQNFVNATCCLEIWSAIALLYNLGLKRLIVLNVLIVINQLLK